MRRALASTVPKTPVISPASNSRLARGLRPVLPWLGVAILTFLLFRLLLGHVYVMRGTCTCGRSEQWYEFNDRPYTIGVRISPQTVVAGQSGHAHFYEEPQRASRY